MSGTDIAFSEIQLRYELYVYLYIRSNVDNDAAAENLCQDTFVEALLALREKRYTPEQHFSAWLLGIATHLISDWKKHKINQPHEPLSEEMEEETAAPVITYSDPHLQKLLGKALEKLNATDCAILIMHAVDEKTYEEISPVVHLSPPAVKQRFLRLCKKLRKVLKALKGKF
jgi:RNA polymerase sigma-70 factor (ECF subfamily)